jgi:hypothetical protein
LWGFEYLAKERTDEEEEQEILMGIPAPLEGDIMPLPPEDSNDSKEEDE